MRLPDRPTPMRLPRRPHRVAAAVLALALPFAGCGSDDAEEPRTDPPATESVADTGSGDDVVVPDVEFESEPIEGGALFGRGGDAAALSAAVEAEECLPDVEECVDGADLLEQLQEHVVAEEWVPFCGLLERLESEPLPSDELEQLDVLHVWLAELRDVAPPRVADELDVLIALLDTAIEAESVEPLVADDEVGARGAAAADEIGEVTDLECYGLE